MLDGMIDVICSNKQFKRFLIFRNQKGATNTNIFEKVADKMNERAAGDGRKDRIIHSQTRDKCKKLVCECESISLSQRIAIGINRYKLEKGYRKLWDILFPFPLLASRESADPSSVVEPSLYNDNQNTDPENGLGVCKNCASR